MPQIEVPIGQWIEVLVEFLLKVAGRPMEDLAEVLGVVIKAMERFLIETVPPWALTLVFAAMTWRLAGWRSAPLTAAGLWLMHALGLWPSAMKTLAMVATATTISVLCGLPVGILVAKSDRLRRVVTPVLDFMQTMPSYVYLIPAVMFFGLGAVPGIMATVVFSLPPVIRLTDLGIRQVPKDLVEASNAFGATVWQTLWRLEIPTALPTVMAGVNQCIMLALSMVVIAAMIGAGGLGADVLRGITRMEIGRGFESGLAVVILAMILDRMTQNLGRPRHRRETS